MGNRLIRERNAPALRQERRIIVPQPALAEPLLWENLPHQQVPNELVRLLFRPPAAQIQQPRMGPFDICNICLDRPADWGIDSCEHHFCRDCVLQLLQEREALGFRLRASVCHYCRRFLNCISINQSRTNGNSKLTECKFECEVRNHVRINVMF